MNICFFPHFHPVNLVVVEEKPLEDFRQQVWECDFHFWHITVAIMWKEDWVESAIEVLLQGRGCVERERERRSYDQETTKRNPG